MNTLNTKNENVDLNLTNVVTERKQAIEFLTICEMLVNEKDASEKLIMRANRKRQNLLSKQISRNERNSKKVIDKNIKAEQKTISLLEKSDFVAEYLSLNAIFSSLKRQSKLFGKNLSDVKKVESIEDAIATKTIQPYHVLGLVDNVNDVFNLVFNGGKFTPAKVYDLASKVNGKNEAEKLIIFNRGLEVAKVLNGIKNESIELTQGLNTLHPICKNVKTVEGSLKTLLNASTCKKLQDLDLNFITESEKLEVIETALIFSEARTIDKATAIKLKNEAIEIARKESFLEFAS